MNDFNEPLIKIESTIMLFANSVMKVSSVAMTDEMVNALPDISLLPVSALRSSFKYFTSYLFIELY